MRLPNLENAVVDIDKLRSYVLNPAHPEGRHKARVFLASLGVAARDAEWLAQALLDGLPLAECQVGLADRYGVRYAVAVPIQRPPRAAVIRTAWIVRAGEDFPRLVTCFVV